MNRINNKNNTEYIFTKKSKLLWTLCDLYVAGQNKDIDQYIESYRKIDWNYYNNLKKQDKYNIEKKALLMCNMMNCSKNALRECSHLNYTFRILDK